MIEEQQNAKRSITDIAAFFTVAGLILYFLGAVYARTFYTDLGIPSSFMDFTYEKIIIRTWILILMVGLGFFTMYYHALIMNKDEEFLPSHQVIFFILLSITLFVIGILTLNRIYNIYLITLVVFLSALTLLVFLFRKKTQFQGSVHKATYIFFITLILPGITFFSYVAKAKYDAAQFYLHYEEDIELTLNHDNLLIHGKYAAYMADKYFIMVENEKCEKELMIINNEEVNHVKFISISASK